MTALATPDQLLSVSHAYKFPGPLHIGNNTRLEHVSISHNGLMAWFDEVEDEPDSVQVLSTVHDVENNVEYLARGYVGLHVSEVDDKILALQMIRAKMQPPILTGRQSEATYPQVSSGVEGFTTNRDGELSSALSEHAEGYDRPKSVECSAPLENILMGGDGSSLNGWPGNQGTARETEFRNAGGTVGPWQPGETGNDSTYPTGANREGRSLSGRAAVRAAHLPGCEGESRNARQPGSPDAHSPDAGGNQAQPGAPVEEVETFQYPNVNTAALEINALLEAFDMEVCRAEY